jgi:putative nucleotidyltransferase with HDIG domain
MTNASPPEQAREMDRRQNTRWELFSPCRIIWQGNANSGQILDLSQEGAMLEASTLPPHGQQVTLFFTLEGLEAQIGGTVIHRSGTQTAFEGVHGFYIEFHEPQKEIMGKMQKLHSASSAGSNGQPLPYEQRRMGSKQLLDKLSEVNKEIWLVLSLILISLLLNFMLHSNQMILGFYTIPTVFSAYFFGRRHATLTAFASIFLVLLVAHFKPLHFGQNDYLEVPVDRWLEMVVWGGILLVTAYAMGTLYEKKERHFSELQQTYKGVLTILQQFIAKDKYTQNHSYRVSVYASNIAWQMGLDRRQVEDIRDAALIHDIGKLDVGREILYKASQLNDEEFQKMRTHVESGVTMLEPVRGSLRRILPIILAHHDRFDGSGYHAIRGDQIPLGARIIAVADAYDSMVSDRPYRKGMPPMDAKEAIVAGEGREFDPEVVKAFLALFRRGKMDVPEIVV